MAESTDIGKRIILLSLEPAHKAQTINANVDTVIAFYRYLLMHEGMENHLSEKLVKFVSSPPKDDHKKALKKVKQQINAFCLRHGYHYEGTKWTQAHLKWLKKIELSALYQETLDEYMATYEEDRAKIERFDARIEEISSQAGYADKVKKLGCFLGIKTHTALSLIVETGDFNRFAKGNVYAAYLGLAPGERSSAEHTNRLGITKAGNSRLRLLLVEAAGGICKGAVGHKSKGLRQRQQGNPAEVISYADKANARMRSRYYRLIRHGKKRNTAVAAIARELACFVWGMMTENIEGKAA